jgi:hypothetical protein
MFIQISRETMLLLINNLHKNVRDNCSFNLRVYIANIPLAKFSWLCYITLYNANSLKIPLNSVSFVKVKAFSFKNKDKSHIFHAKYGKVEAM